MMTLAARIAMREQAAAILDADAEIAAAWLRSVRGQRVEPAARATPDHWRRLASLNRARASELRTEDASA